MIEVTAKLNRFGITPEESHSQLCRVEIANEGTGSATRGNYKVILFSKSNAKIRECKIENWPRKARPAWRLIAEAFKALEESK